ncbi:MAG TPA: hypothetical protein VGB55_00835 [Tepidisphaeraceae bacterium]
MKNSPSRVPLLLAVLVAAPLAKAASPEQADVAEILMESADSLLQSREGVSVARPLAEIAGRFIGDDARLIRQAIDLRLQLGDRTKALELLTAYRRIDPGDQLAQVQFIDLTVDGMQSADEREAYLAKVVGVEAVAKPVRAHAAVRWHDVLRERMKDAEANAALDKALALNPVNPRALQLASDRAFATAGAPQRAAALVNLIKGNPMQPATLAALAEELARAGATEPAAAMFRKSADMSNAVGMPPDVGDLVNIGAGLSAAGAGKDASTAAAAATQIAPGFARGWFLRVLLAKQSGDAAAYDATVAEARGALTKGLMQFAHAVDPAAPQVTKDTPASMPDVRVLATRVAGLNRADVKEAFVTSLGDIAWLDACYTAQAPDPAVMDALKTLSGENSALVTRIAGFTAVSAGRLDEVQVKLGAIAEKDPLARAGLLAMRLKKNEPKPEIAAEASKLLQEMPVDVWSATLRWLVTDAGPITFKTADADAVIAEAAKLPEAWLNLPRTPQTFYLVDLTPLRVGVVPGEPLLLRLTMQNTSEFPLMLGPGGVVDQVVQLDAATRGPIEQYLPAIAAARLSGRMVLQPRESVSTIVRIDTPRLSSLMNSAPHVAISLYASAVTNPRFTKEAVVPGPGGFREQAETIIDRPSISITKDNVRNTLYEQTQDNDPLRRLRAVQAIATNVLQLRGLPESASAAPLLESAEKVLQNVIEKDASSAVRSTARQLLTSVRPASEQEEGLRGMLASPDIEARTIGTMMTFGRPQSQRQTLLKPLAESDADPTLKALAAAVMAVPDAPPATQPEK